MSKIAGVKRKDQITRIAQNKFRYKGFRSVSMRELADHVGIKAASFYNHFPSKHHILRDICFRMSDEFFNELNKALNETKKPDEQLSQAIKSHIKVIAGNVDASAVFFHDWSHLDEEDLLRFKLLRKKYENVFRKIIREGMNTGIFDKQDETFIVLTIFSSLNWVYEWYDPQGKLTPDEIANNLIKLILSGIRK